MRAALYEWVRRYRFALIVEVAVTCDVALSARDRLTLAVAHATGTAPELGTPVWSVLLAEPAAIEGRIG